MFQVQQQPGSHKFWDDCGAWSDSRGRKLFVDTHTMSEVRRLPNGMFGMQKRTDNSRVLQELHPQPEVIEVHQLCNRLKRDSSYQRKITYTLNSECFVSEYVGQFPANVEVHGNAVFCSAEYVRTKPETLHAVKDAVSRKTTIPSKVYQQMKATASDDQECPRNKKQVSHGQRREIF